MQRLVAKNNLELPLESASVSSPGRISPLSLRKVGLTLVRQFGWHRELALRPRVDEGLLLLINFKEGML